MNTLNPTEKKFEDHIEHYLSSIQYKSIHFKKYDRTLCLIRDEVIDFIKKTQKDAWEKLKEIYENDTGTVQVVSTPPREICHHLWIEYGNCPRVCNALLPGDFCTLNSDCKDIRSCKGFCCIISDANCHSCANNTGHCDLCTSGMGFNATGNLTCGECTYWRYLTNNTCHLFTNCTAGLYPIFDGNETIDRECQDVPHGYFTNETNQQPLLWTYCVNNTYAVGGNSSHDTICTNKTDCVAGSYVFDNIENEDRVCAECIDGFSNITNQLECYNYTNCTSYQSNGTNTSDTICN